MMRGARMLVATGALSGAVFSMFASNRDHISVKEWTAKSESRSKESFMKAESSNNMHSSFLCSIKSNRFMTLCEGSSVAPEQPVQPASQVVELTGASFRDAVFRGDKDLLVVFYAPWCGYCKRLFPIWEELATAEQGTKTVAIAQMDMTQNSIRAPGVDIQGYPTIYLFRRGNSSRPIVYEGSRDVKSFQAFLRKHSA